MSNDLVSQQLPVPSSQMNQLEPISNKLDASLHMQLMGPGNSDSLQQMSVSDMHVEMIGSGYSVSAPQQIMSDVQTGLMPPMFNDIGSQILSISNQPSEQLEPQTYNQGSQQYFLPNRQPGELGSMSNVALQQLSSMNKRKAMEPMSNNSLSQNSSIFNKRVAQVEHRPWLQQTSTPDRRSVQPMQPMSTSPRTQILPAQNWKTVQKDSLPSKSGPQKHSAPKGQSAPAQPSPKDQNESSESVRSKMRQSLASALALVSQQQDKPSKTEKGSQNDAAGSPGKMQANLQLSGSEEPKEKLPSMECSSDSVCVDGQSAPQEKNAGGNSLDSSQTIRSDVQDFQYSSFLPDEDVSFSDNFFVKDELLQGNGLSWVLEPEIEIADKKEISIIEKRELRNDQLSRDEDKKEEQSNTPEILASRIEAELFKLFGGVNKKYKEKGRSLLFNLKDRNNPELRERVMSGDIPPERLCSMTAEELASKELSQWRMAKAEELAQMVILTDTDVDMRRLVKKTHKGEFQVEVEQVDTASADVSVGTSTLTRVSAKADEAEALTSSKAVGNKDETNEATIEKKSSLEDQGGECTITIPSNEGTDLMQGLMVDNELKDTDLPPIVSLDEFMESLNKEPPFENLPVDARKSTLMSGKSDCGFDSETKSPIQSPKGPINASPAKPGNMDVNAKSDVNLKVVGDSPVKLEAAPPKVEYKGELVWDGSLQLNVSSMASVLCVFKSGEKTSAKEWATMVEIKGRVRLDAFEKFLQDLPMSRSRAVMIVHFVGKEETTKSESGSLSEVAESYLTDARVGYAEPASGVELYFCPPHTKTYEMLSKILPKDQHEALNSIENGLIGVVVWRRPQLTSSTISPNSLSHHKHSSKKQQQQQHFTSSRMIRHQDKDASNLNVNMKIFSSKLTPQGRHIYAKTKIEDDSDDDDVPPGFGPGATTRDDDDLPEFNFGGGPIQTPPPCGPAMGPGVHPLLPPAQNPSNSRPVDHMRELIQKYGQTQNACSSASADRGGINSNTTGFGGIKPWNDDDDDIPEWQPTAPQPPVPRGYQRPIHLVSQQQPPQHIGVHPHQQYRQPAMPLNVMQGQRNTSGHSWVQGTYGAPPHGGGSTRPSPPSTVYGPGWRQGAPKSRGF